MTGRKKRSGISATELTARLESDPEHQRMVQAAEAERQERERLLAEAEQPVVADLRAVGVQVDSVWDLVNTSEPYPAALPVLMEHLERGGYPERVMEGLGRALAVKPSVAFWERLKARWLHARDSGEEDGVAVALAACATKKQLDDLIEFLAVEERGESRLYFIRSVVRVGGDRGYEVLESLRDDPVLGQAATARLKRRRK
jgi:hypothetical protein